MLIRYLTGYLALLVFPTAVLASTLWQDVSSPLAKRSSSTLQSRPLAASTSTLRQLLSSAPEAISGQSGISFELPLPDGRLINVSVTNSPILSPSLRTRHPELQTFRFQGLPPFGAYHGRLDITPNGFHAIIFGPDGISYINPESVYNPDSENNRYRSIGKPASKPLTFSCGMKQHAPTTVSATASSPTAARTTSLRTFGSQLRTYRLALAATNEYRLTTGSGSGSENITIAAFAEMLTAINRVNAIYEKDLAVFLQIVTGTELISTNSDDYSNDDGETMLAENQARIDTLASSLGFNYDIGHVFSTGGGGIAYLASVCNSRYKAQGVTGSSNPTGDPFYIDYVAHEIGHQLGATHSFNADGADAGSCEGNRQDITTGGILGSSAYEVGSGSTIMSYAGICATQNLQSNSDAYFHARSIEQIRDFIEGNIPGYDGSSCGTSVSTSDLTPVADAGDDYTIPANTPFVLTGSATDSDTDSETILYTWEQFDLGAATTSLTEMHTDLGSGPLMRSWSGSNDATRYIPTLSAILAGDLSANKGERLPTTDRSLTFRLTVRSGNSGVSQDDMSISVDKDSGPFAVTNQITSPLTGNTALQVTWNTANTEAMPVNCSQVDILLATNTQHDFDITLAAATDNDGSHTVTLPDIATTQGKLMVKCSDNIFFNLSNGYFTLLNSGNYLTLQTSSSANEGSDITFTATLLHTSTETITVDYHVQSAGDYPAGVADFNGSLPSGTITFLPSETVQSITLPTTDDSDYENDETFHLLLSNPVNIGLANTLATGIITNNDPAALPTLSIVNQISQNEGDSGTTSFTFLLRLDKAGENDITLNYAVTGTGSAPTDADDFGGLLPSGALTIAAGETQATITLNVNGDLEEESDETFLLTLSAVENAQLDNDSVTNTIINDDTPPSESKSDSSSGIANHTLLLLLTLLTVMRKRQQYISDAL